MVETDQCRDGIVDFASVNAIEKVVKVMVLNDSRALLAAIVQLGVCSVVAPHLGLDHSVVTYAHIRSAKLCRDHFHKKVETYHNKIH